MSDTPTEIKRRPRPPRRARAASSTNNVVEFAAAAAAPKRMKVVVTGGNGVLGSRLVNSSGLAHFLDTLMSRALT